MAQKDFTSKMLESEPDVFADIFNTLLFETSDTKIIDAENTLVDEPTEGLYKNYDGNLRNMFQDIAKGYRNGSSESFLACFNIENESMIKRTVPLKCFGYKFATLKKQQDMYENKRKALIELKNKAKNEGDSDKLKMMDKELSELGKFHTIPFVSIVLNFDDKEWDEPTNLEDLNIDSVYSQFDQPFHIKVFNVKFFTPEERARFTSDFRIFLEMFCTNALPETLKAVSLRHPTELVDMIVAFTNNDKLKDIRNQVAISELEGKVINMGNIFDNIATKEVIESAKYLVEKMTSSEVVAYISSRLGISLDEAKEIYEKEVLMLETV